MHAIIQGTRALHDGLLTGLCGAFWAGAALLLLPAVRARAQHWWDALDGAPEERVRGAVLAAGAAAVLWCAWLKGLQYRGFQLTMDTSIIANTAANVLLGEGFKSTIDGTPSALAVHFAFFVPLFLAPLVLVRASPLPLLLVQAAAVASVGPAAFLLARRMTGSNALGLAVMALTWAHAGFHELVTANAENAVYGPPLFLWGAVFWLARRRAAGAGFWGAALTTREQFPFTLAGLGVYHALSGQGAVRRRWAAGALVVGGAALLWFAEMRLVGSYSQLVNDAYWGQFAHFGADKGEVIRTVLTRPDRVLRHVLWPPSHLAPFVVLLAGMAFLPLASLGGLAALIVAATHHFLMLHYDFRIQYASYAFGPLVFAAACGAASLAERPWFPRARPWLAAAVLAAAGGELRSASRVVHPSFGSQYVETAPGLIGRIPRNASVWADETAGLWLSGRAQVKLFHLTSLHARFDTLLFRPDYVLADKGTLLFLPPADQARVVGFLAREGYRKEGEAGTLVLLRSPQAPRGGPSPDLALPPDPAGAALAAPFRAALFDTPEARRDLAAYPPDLRYAPESPEQHAAFARVLAARGLWGPAAAHGRAALARRPDFPEALNNLGNALAAGGDLNGAEAALRRALALAPHGGLTAYNLGNVLIRLGRAADAVPMLETAVRLEGGDARVYNSLGGALLLSGRREEAVKALEAALALDPKLTDAARNLAAARNAPARPRR